MKQIEKEQNFLVPKQEIVDNDYDLSINKYKKVEYVAVEYPSTQKILEELRNLEKEVARDLLYSTGIRVGELVNLNIDDIELNGRECVVYGKGDKGLLWIYFHTALSFYHLNLYINLVL